MRVETTEFGVTLWSNEKGEAHNIIGPAVINLFGTAFWYRNGLRHRLDGPAEICGAYTYWSWLGKDISEQKHSILSNIMFFTNRVKI